MLPCGPPFTCTNVKDGLKYSYIVKIYDVYLKDDH